jgi:hypothetical protein
MFQIRHVGEALNEESADQEPGVATTIADAAEISTCQAHRSYPKRFCKKAFC